MQVSKTTTLQYSLGIFVLTIGSAVAEGPRDALCQLKSCHMLHREITFGKACNG